MRELKLPEGNLPIAFADTEKGSDWILPRVRKAGLDMVTAKTRAFADLLTLIPEAEASASVLLLTHFWVELCDTYATKKAQQRTSAASMPTEAPRDKNSLQRGVVLDEINDLLLHHDAAWTSAADRKRRSELMRRHFGTASKTQIEELMSLFDLRAGYNSLHRELEGAPSRYSVTLKADVAMDDVIPDFDAKHAGEQLTAIDAG